MCLPTEAPVEHAALLARHRLAHDGRGCRARGQEIRWAAQARLGRRKDARSGSHGGCFFLRAAEATAGMIDLATRKTRREHGLSGERIEWTRKFPTPDRDKRGMIPSLS